MVDKLRFVVFQKCWRSWYDLNGFILRWSYEKNHNSSSEDNNAESFSFLGEQWFALCAFNHAHFSIYGNRQHWVWKSWWIYDSLNWSVADKYFLNNFQFIPLKLVEDKRTVAATRQWVLWNPPPPTRRYDLITFAMLKIVFQDCQLCEITRTLHTS